MKPRRSIRAALCAVLAVLIAALTVGVAPADGTTTGGAQAWAASPSDTDDLESVSPPTAVSSATVDPFAGCTSDYPDLQPGTNYPNSEVEPSVVVNPANEQNIVAVWQQDRWSNAGSRGNVTAASFDGGASWTTVTATKTSFCTGGMDVNGGAMFRASDPWLSFSRDGTAYLISVGIPYFNQSAIFVNRSADGGLTWSDPTLLTFEASNAFNDKPSVTADPNDARLVYAIWTRDELPNEHAAPPAEVHGAGFRGPLWFARSTDGGASWEAARPIYDPGEENEAFAAQIVALPDTERFHGQLVDIFDLNYTHTNAAGLRGHHVALIRSGDNGLTWSTPTRIANALAVPVVDPLTAAPVRPGLFYPDTAVDPNSGALYAVWHDGRFSTGRYDDIALSMSTDGGSRWTAPVRVNQTPATAETANRQAFTPSVAVAADGSVGVGYYDFRHNGTDADPSQPLETDRFLSRCERPSASAPDLCTGGWTETRLTPRSFNLRVAPNARGLFLGDFVGLASTATSFVSLFPQANSPTDPATVYLTSVP
jgi:hypothetical protein